QDSRGPPKISTEEIKSRRLICLLQKPGSPVMVVSTPERYFYFDIRHSPRHFTPASAFGSQVYVPLYHPGPPSAGLRRTPDFAIFIQDMNRAAQRRSCCRLSKIPDGCPL